MDANSITVQSMNINKFHSLQTFLPEIEGKASPSPIRRKKNGPMFDLYVAPKHVTLPTVRVSLSELEESSVLSNTSQVVSVSKSTSISRDMKTLKSKNSSQADGSSDIRNAHQIDSFSQAFISKKNNDNMASLIINSSKLPSRTYSEVSPLKMRNEDRVRNEDRFYPPLSDRTDCNENGTFTYRTTKSSPVPVQRKPSVLSIGMDSVTNSLSAEKGSEIKSPPKETYSSAVAFKRPVGRMLTPFRMDKGLLSKTKQGTRPGSKVSALCGEFGDSRAMSKSVDSGSLASTLAVPSYQRIHGTSRSPSGSVSGDPVGIYGQYDTVEEAAEARAEAVHENSRMTDAVMVPTSIVLPQHLQKPPSSSISNDSESLAFNESRTLDQPESVTSFNTFGDNPVSSAPGYRIHSRLMGWKLTSLPRRKTLLSMLDYLDPMSEEAHGDKGVEQVLVECQKLYHKGMSETEDTAQRKLLSSNRQEMHERSTVQTARPASMQLTTCPMSDRAVTAWESYISRQLTARSKTDIGLRAEFDRQYEEKEKNRMSQDIVKPAKSIRSSYSGANLGDYREKNRSEIIGKAQSILTDIEHGNVPFAFDMPGFPTSSAMISIEAMKSTELEENPLDLSIDRTSYQFSPKQKSITNDEIVARESDWSRIMGMDVSP